MSEQVCDVVTDRVEYMRSGVVPQTDQEARRYIPQHPAAQNLYTLLRENFDKSILDAMREVLMVAVGSLSGEPDTEFPA